MPNAFTPNNDGLNDEFKPVMSYTTSGNYSLKIFSRTGEVIFQSSDPQNGWDGTVNGKPAPAGAYVYTISAETQESGLFEQTGTVILMFP